MLKNQTINLKMVEKVASSLEEINKDVIYIGGAVISLYVTDDGAEQPRPTKDIDISVKISTYKQMDDMREKLATKNIYPSPTDSVIYRYTLDGILIDFIPYEKTSLGHTNSWLKPGFKKAIAVKLGKAQIKILPVSLFLATKWEAYNSRGNDPRISQDFEDIIYIIDNNLDVVNDIKSADMEVRSFLKKMSKEILSHSSLHEIIEYHINPYTANERRKLVIDKLKKIMRLSLSK